MKVKPGKYKFMAKAFNSRRDAGILGLECTQKFRSHKGSTDEKKTKIGDWF
jgi:hypothetical protein